MQGASAPDGMFHAYRMAKTQEAPAMNDLAIISTDLGIAHALETLLVRRRASTRTVEDAAAAAGAHTIICSAHLGSAAGKPVNAVELARSMGAKRIVIVDESAPAFRIEEELGGRCLRVALPHSAAGMLQDGPLLQLADRIAAPHTVMVAADAATGRLIDLASHVAKFDVSVFINGPTGSGKEVLARLVHACSTRADKPFVAINCAAIPENMLEALLFGHEKGAFTGAGNANCGLIRAADGGTLLLDEISEMPLGLQAKLLRVIQERRVTPLGAQKDVAVDIRIVSTSNRDMAEEIRRGTFREDLFYRLNVFPLETLPLALRPDDIPVLATAMLLRHTPQGQVTPVLSEAACAALAAHHWPGNVRELENVMQRALVMHRGDEVAADDIMLSACASHIRLASAA